MQQNMPASKSALSGSASAGLKHFKKSASSLATAAQPEPSNATEMKGLFNSSGCTDFAKWLHVSHMQYILPCSRLPTHACDFRKKRVDTDVADQCEVCALAALVVSNQKMKSVKNKKPKATHVTKRICN